MTTTASLEDLELRRDLLEARRHVDAVNEIFYTANNYDLRKIRDPKQRAKTQRIRNLSKELAKELASIR